MSLMSWAKIWPVIVILHFLFRPKAWKLLSVHINNMDAELSYLVEAAAHMLVYWNPADPNRLKTKFEWKSSGCHNTTHETKAINPTIKHKRCSKFIHTSRENKQECLADDHDRSWSWLQQMLLCRPFRAGGPKYENSRNKGDNPNHQQRKMLNIHPFK